MKNDEQDIVLDQLSVNIKHVHCNRALQQKKKLIMLVTATFDIYSCKNIQK